MPDELDAFLDEYPLDIRALSVELRVLVLQTLPEVKEFIYPAWKTMMYGRGGDAAAQVCAIAPAPGYVNLFFQRGKDLPDPHGLLTGQALKLRVFRAEPGQLLPAVELADLLRAGFKLALAEN